MRKWIDKFWLLGLILLILFLFPIHARAEGQARQRPPRLAVLPTTDQTGWGLSDALQYSLGKLCVSTNLFEVGSSNYVLTGFSRKELKQAFQSNRAPFLIFTYIDKTRVSVFMFNAYYEGQFIASNKSLENPPNGKISSDFVEKQFKAAFEETIATFLKNTYQKLPEVEGDDKSDLVNDSVVKQISKADADKMKYLFNEVSQIEDKPFYVSANIGMARYTGTANAASTVNFGVSLGGRLGRRFSVAAGADFFSYIFAHGDGYYKLPLAEKFISFSVIGTLGSVMASFTENKGYGSQNTTLKTGSFLFGPGLSIDIPLLGATLRGELRYYMGSSTILVGTYGLLISI